MAIRWTLRLRPLPQLVLHYPHCGADEVDHRLLKHKLRSQNRRERHEHRPRVAPDGQRALLRFEIVRDRSCFFDGEVARELESL